MILVVGGAGYVGSLLQPGLIAGGHEVRVLDLARPAGDVEWVQGSATESTALAIALDGVDAVIHAAMGQPGPDGSPEPVSTFSSNVTSVYMTLAAAGARGIGRAILTSSISVFSNTPVPVTDRVLEEASPMDATDLYGLSKRLAEQVGQAAADEWGMAVTALRLGWPTRDDQYPTWSLPQFPEPAVIRCNDGTPIPALAASDLTRAVLAALGRSGGGFEAFHIVGDDGSGRCWNTAKAARELGWRPRKT